MSSRMCNLIREKQSYASCHIRNLKITITIRSTCQPNLCFFSCSNWSRRKWILSFHL